MLLKSQVLKNIFMLWLRSRQAAPLIYLCLEKYLTELDLRDNVLTKLPETVGEMEHLTSINLANNRFSVFPDKLAEVATLERIDLEGNSITGKKYIYVSCSFEIKSYSVNGWTYSASFDIFLNRNTFGEAVCHASTEVAKCEVKPSGHKHAVCSAVSLQVWHFVNNRVLKYVMTHRL